MSKGEPDRGGAEDETMRSHIFALVLLLAAGPAQATLIISEYIEGGKKNQAIELWNTDGSDLDLTGWTIDIYEDGATTPSWSISLVGTVLATDVFVITRDKADPAMLAVADQTSKDLKFNGNDAVVLAYMGTPIDRIGQVGFDPGQEWGSGDESTKDNTIRRLPSDTTPDPNIFDPYVLPSVGWVGFPKDDFTTLGVDPVTEQAPEVETVAMLMMGLLALGIMGQRRQRRADLSD